MRNPPATHPVEPEPPPDPQEPVPNTSKLPVEPEFGPLLPPPPEDPGVQHPHL